MEQKQYILNKVAAVALQVPFPVHSLICAPAFLK